MLFIDRQIEDRERLTKTEDRFSKQLGILAPDQMMQQQQIKTIRLLGDCQLKTQNNESVSIHGKKNTALFASILLDPARRINRGYAEALLWSQRSIEQAKASLRQCLSDLRRQLQSISNIELVTDRNEIALDLEDVFIDAELFVNAARADDLAARIAGVETYGGPFLGSLYIRDPSFEEWLNNQRLKYQEIFTNLLKSNLAELSAGADSEQIKRLAHRLLEVDNCSEPGHASLMKCYFAEGDKAKVIQQYRLCCDVLAKELAVKPSQELTGLFEEIRTSETSRAFLAVEPNLVSKPKSQIYGLSVAVFTFAEIGESARGGGLGFDIAGDIRTGLSRFNWMSVASRYAARDIESGSGFQKICNEINVRYVIDGSIKCASQFDIVKIELLDGIDSTSVWGESYKTRINDPQEYERAMAKIICQVEVELRAWELKRVRALQPDEFSAYDCVIRAVSNIQLMTPESFHHADALFNRAIELDPDFAAVYTWKIYWEIFCIGQGWAPDPQQEVKKANQIANEGLARDPEDSLALAIQGHFESFVEHNYVYARELQKRAYQLNPYSSMVLILNSLTYSYCGKPVRALERLETLEDMTRIESQHLFLYYIAKCVAYTFNHDYETGVEWGRKCIGKAKTFTNGYKPLLCCLGHLGRTDEAKPLLDTLLSLEPSFGTDKMEKVYPFEKEEDRRHYIDGLKKAGLGP